MADATLLETFAGMQERLVQMGINALSNTVQSYSYRTARNNTFPYWDADVAEVTSNLTGFSEMQLLTVTVNQYLHCGTKTQGFEGQLQQAIYWSYMPVCMQYFIQHQALTYPGETDYLPFLDPENSRVLRARPELVEGYYRIRFDWVFQLQTSFERLC